MKAGFFDCLDIFLCEDFPGALLFGHGVQIFGGVGQSDTLFHCPAAQLPQKHPQLVAGGLAFALHFQGDDTGLIVAAEDLAHLHIVQLGALLVGQTVVLVHALGDLPLMFFVPAFVDLSKSHIEFVGDVNICETLKSLLCLATGSIESMQTPFFLAIHGFVRFPERWEMLPVPLARLRCFRGAGVCRLPQILQNAEPSGRSALHLMQMDILYLAFPGQI